jgi:hypothetical protein
MTPMDPYKIEYSGCTLEHKLTPDIGYIGGFFVYPTDMGALDVTAEGTNPRTTTFYQCGITQNLTVEAQFQPLIFDITAIAYGNGSIDPS